MCVVCVPPPNPKNVFSSAQAFTYSASVKEVSSRARGALAEAVSGVLPIAELNQRQQWLLLKLFVRAAAKQMPRRWRESLLTPHAAVLHCFVGFIQTLAVKRTSAHALRAHKIRFTVTHGLYVYVISRDLRHMASGVQRVETPGDQPRRTNCPDPVRSSTSARSVLSGYHYRPGPCQTVKVTASRSLRRVGLPAALTGRGRGCIPWAELRAQHRSSAEEAGSTAHSQLDRPAPARAARRHATPAVAAGPAAPA